MGTRGFQGFLLDGELKITYNHFDSYPDGLGVDVLNFLSEALQGGYELDALVDAVREIELIDESSTPTTEQIEKYKRFANTSVSTGKLDEWYVLLRELQGNLEGYLNAGVMPDGEKFALDSLFCEWGYLVNLDNNTFEVYKGFQHSPPTEGYWSDPQFSFYEDRGYYPVNRVGVWALTQLPDESEFIGCLYDDEDEDV